MPGSTPGRSFRTPGRRSSAATDRTTWATRPSSPPPHALLRAAAAHVAGVGARACRKSGGGRLYQRKDFSADAVRTLYRNFETGMIDEYLAARPARDAALRLIEPERVA